jgi:membrane protease YdiL (CAAX protease family)
VETLQQHVLPMPPEMIKAFYDAVVAPKRHLALDLFALALSPAICEEALFRGVLLQSMRRTMSIRSAVMINGLLFGLFHLSPWRFFPTMILGMLLALIVIRSGSIWPGVLFHFLNNATALVAGRLFGDPTSGETTVDLPLLAAAVVLFVGGLWVSARGVREARAGPSGPPGR